MDQNNSTYRILFTGILLLLVASTIMTLVSGDCCHWVGTIAAILVLFRVARGADR